MENFDKVSVENFVLACNDILSGKFLDINKKLNNVMDSITKSEDILTYLADAITDYDEETSFENAFSLDKKTKNGKISLPQSEKERVALTVSILNFIQTGKINITRFLETYFKEGTLTPTQNFLEKIIRPFRDSICRHFSVSENVTEKEIEEHKKESLKKENEEKKKEEELLFEEEYPQIDELIIEIKKTTREILSRLKFEHKKKDNIEDLEFILNSLLNACETKNLMVINGLIIGVNYVASKFKSVRYLVRDLNDLIYDYYNFLTENSSKNDIFSQKNANFEEKIDNFEENKDFEEENEDEE